MSIRIIPVENAKDLHCHYSGQIEAQGIYVELDCKNETLSISYNGEIGNAVPFSVYHGFDQRFAIPLLNTSKMNDLLEEILPIAEKVLEGFEEVYNGQNWVASFTEEAEEAIEEISSLCDASNFSEDDLITVYHIEEYFEYSKPKLDISCKDIEIFINDFKLDIESDNSVLITGDIDKYFKNYLIDNRRNKIEEYISLLEFNNKISDYFEDNEENPTFWVKWNNGRLSKLYFNSEGKLTWERTEYILDEDEDLDTTAIGRAIATNYYRNKYKNCENPQREKVINWKNGTIKADNYIAAMCNEVPEKYQHVCKTVAGRELKRLMQKDFESENVLYFENKVIIDSKNLEISKIRKQIKELENQIKEIEKTIPENNEATYFSKSNNSHACKYFNLFGHYPELIK